MISSSYSGWQHGFQGTFNEEVDPTYLRILEENQCFGCFCGAELAAIGQRSGIEKGLHQ